VVKIATVKTNLNGFTNGDMYFGNGRPGGIGWVSADGAAWTTNWVTLPGETNAISGLYVDQTGVFSNGLIAVTGDQNPHYDGSSRGVWRIDSQANATLIARIVTPSLEGVITMPNDTNRWGPWAGKILPGDRATWDSFHHPDPRIYAVDTNGTVTSFALGIHPADFDIFPPLEQNLYCCGTEPFGSRIWKVPGGLVGGFGGDLLITQPLRFDYPTFPSRLFIVHWDGTKFINRSITPPEALGICYPFDTNPFDSYWDIESSTFAPIDITPPQ
jgi:hypothetical protein